MLQGYNVVDFAGPIGLLCVLIVGVGEIRRWLSSPKQVQYVLGAIFGLVAVIEMEMPISPFEGVIIDLRIVPVILAGAFLGWRGLAVCLIMAIATRLYIGGVGAGSGVASVVISGALGALWTSATRAHLRRGFWQLCQLGLISGLSFVSAALLPADIAIWFVWNAAPILWLIYLVTIPIVGALIQREIRRIEAEHFMREGASTCPDSGLLRPASFIRETLQLAATEPKGTVAGLLVIWPVYAKWLGTFWGSGLTSRVQAAMAIALVGRLTHSGRIGLSRHGHLLVPLTAEEVAQHQDATESLSRRLAQTELRLSAGQKFRFGAKLRVLPAQNDAELFDLLQSVESIESPSAVSCDGQPTSYAAAQAGIGTRQSRDSLFAKLDATLAVSRTDTVRLND